MADKSLEEGERKDAPNTPAGVSPEVAARIVPVRRLQPRRDAGDATAAKKLKLIAAAEKEHDALFKHLVEERLLEKVSSAGPYKVFRSKRELSEYVAASRSTVPVFNSPLDLRVCKRPVAASKRGRRS
jgi:hypothetical protein